MIQNLITIIFLLLLNLSNQKDKYMVKANLRNFATEVFVRERVLNSFYPKCPARGKELNYLHEGIKNDLKMALKYYSRDDPEVLQSESLIECVTDTLCLAVILPKKLIHEIAQVLITL